jgi:hypothetical protein
MENYMFNMSELMRQARVFMAHNPDFIPLHYVEEVAFYGNVDVYVVAQGVDINTPEGCHTLNWESALYLVCPQLCDMGVGNRPYLPHPYLRDPVIVEPEVEVVVKDHEEMPQDQPDEPAVDPLDIGDDGVRIYGPFIGPVPDWPPMVHFPSGDPVQDHREQPEPKLKPELKPQHDEYAEPMDDENKHLFF